LLENFAIFRLCKKVNQSSETSLEFIPLSYVEPLLIDAMFARTAPLEVDVGCGEGAFLVTMATRFPERNFLGIERLLGRVRKTCRRADHAGLKNIRVLRVESAYAVRHLLPRGLVAVFHVMFPDPWPKRKHRRRRLINGEFLDSVWAALQCGGELRLTTDDRDYFEQMKKVSALRTDFVEMKWPFDSDYPQTDFEKHFRAQGLPIHRLLLRKV
jgi:tRNA (guanine-N7-)-methyltransferase